MVSVDNNDNGYAVRPEPSRSRLIPFLALIIGVGLVAVLLWLNFGLSSHVSKLEERVSSLQNTPSHPLPSRELADVSSRLDTLTQGLNDHLNSLPAEKEMAQNSPAMLPPSNNGNSMQDSASMAAKLPSQAAQADTMPKNSAPAATAEKSKSKSALPAPISTMDIAQPKPASTGNWVINLASVSSSESADQEVARLGKLDIKADVSHAESKGKVWYRIQVPGYASYDEAINARSALEEKLGISGTWVGQRK